MAAKKKTKNKYLVVDDEITEEERPGFVNRIGVSSELALFAQSYDNALEILKTYGSEIAICFLDSRIPKNTSQLYDYSASKNKTEWGISLVPEINRIDRNIKIIIYSAYVAQNFLKKEADAHNSIIGFFEKPAEDSYLQNVYLQAIGENKLQKIAKTEIISSFDYAQYDSEISKVLWEKTNLVNQLIKKTVDGIIEIGSHLLDVKELIPHGQFEAWLKTTGLSLRSAGRFMQVAKRFSSANLTDIEIGISALYQLSSNSTPNTVVEEVFARGKKGEVITDKLVKEIISSHKNQNEEDSIPEQLTFDSPQPQVQESKSSSQIIEVVRGKTQTDKLGNHLIFCGDPNSSEFQQLLPSNIALSLSFPTQPTWYPYFESQSQMSFSTQHKDLYFQELLAIIKEYIATTTDSQDNVVICFLPHTSIFLMAHQLECNCFIAEPDPTRYQEIKEVWEKLT